MTTHEIANRLVELCRNGDFEAAQKELFADDAVSIEPEATPDFQKETKGLQHIIEKGHKFQSMVEAVHAVNHIWAVVRCQFNSHVIKHGYHHERARPYEHL